MPISAFLESIKQLSEGRLDALNLVGNAEILTNAGRADLTVQLYRLWISGHPADPVLPALYYNLGLALSAIGQHTDACRALEESLAINPDFHPARINLGLFRVNCDDREQALREWDTLLERLKDITPTNLTYKKLALRHQAIHLQEAQRHAEAEAALLQSYGLDRQQTDVLQTWFGLRQEQCKWPVAQPADGLDSKVLLQSLHPLSAAAYTDDPLLQLAGAWNLSRGLTPTEGRPVSAWNRGGDSGARRRIGYLSSDLRAHAVGYLLPEVFELHDRDAFEIFAFYCGSSGPDVLQPRLKSAIEHWVDITSLSNAAAAERIMADGIDILVDLNGHTRGARTELLALRPAPIIVNWLGYPGSMGTDCHHYIIADDWIIPEDHELYYSETVLRLPCYQPNDRKRVAATLPASRTAFGLPETGVVYCCFNSPHKITRFTFERWMRILREVPDSVLWLYETATETSERLRAAAAEQGVAPERVIFAPKMANAVHLARYGLADLFLDTVPYGAHTTASDALWMGVPILTVSGHSFASRVCGSLARAAGLPELVCDDPEAYVELAVALGRAPQDIESLKQRLRAQRDTCTLFDMERLVRSLEQLYGEMWERFLAGRLPVPDLRNLDVYLEVASEEDRDETEVLAWPHYQEWFREKLARRHRSRPVTEDGRLWGKAAAATTP